jgi:hypothetical protein
MTQDEAVEMRRELMKPPATESPGGLVNPNRGRVIAARSYVKQCHLQGRPPDLHHFDRLAGIVEASDEERAAFRAEVFGERPEAVSE